MKSLSWFSLADVSIALLTLLIPPLTLGLRGKNQVLTYTTACTSSVAFIDCAVRVRNSACTRVELRGQLGNHFSPSIFTWVLGIGGSQATRDSHSRHLHSPQNHQLLLAHSQYFTGASEWRTIQEQAAPELLPRAKHRLRTLPARCPRLSLRTSLGRRQFPYFTEVGICPRSQIRRGHFSGLMSGHSL